MAGLVRLILTGGTLVLNEPDAAADAAAARARGDSGDGGGEGGSAGGAADAAECATGDEAVALTRQINRLMLRLYGTFLSEDGTVVDYAGLGESALFRDEVLPQLRRLNSGVSLAEVASLPRAAITALFLNLYNVLTIHGTVARGKPATSRARLQLFSATGYRVGGSVFTLDDIEHGVLRGNRPHPSGLVSFMSTNTRVGSRATDDRLALVTPDDEVDPRIHFAMVCGARSCPPVRLFNPDTLERDLALAAAGFCGPDGGNVVILEAHEFLEGVPLPEDDPKEGVSLPSESPTWDQADAAISAAAASAAAAATNDDDDHDGAAEEDAAAAAAADTRKRGDEEDGTQQEADQAGGDGAAGNDGGEDGGSGEDDGKVDGEDSGEQRRQDSVKRTLTPQTVARHRAHSGKHCRDARRARLSMIFKWFMRDFIPDPAHNERQLLEYIARQTTDEAWAAKVLAAAHSPHLEIAWIPYDWTSNAKE